MPSCGWLPLPIKYLTRHDLYLVFVSVLLLFLHPLVILIMMTPKLCYFSFSGFLYNIYIHAAAFCFIPRYILTLNIFYIRWID